MSLTAYFGHISVTKSLFGFTGKDVLGALILFMGRSVLDSVLSLIQ